MPNRYKVEFHRLETYCVDVEAPNEAEATEAAITKLEQHFKNGTHHYHETADPETTITNVYDVTHTDDPFNP